MKKILIVIILITLLSPVFSETYFSPYSSFIEDNHYDVYKSIEKMALDYTDDVTKALEIINDQCLSLYIMINAYDGFSENKKGLFVSFYALAVNGEFINWANLLEFFSEKEIL